MDDKVTHCKKCGKELTYKTKKKLWCEDCNPYKDVIIYKGFGSKLPQKSQIEFNIQNWLFELTKRPIIIGGYYNWLLSAKGYPLQLDFLIYGDGKEPFAIEVDGPQHHAKQFFQTEEDFDTLHGNDALKDEIMAQKGIKFIRITECYSKDHLLNILFNNKCEL